MEWYVYLAYFFAGALLVNGVPHFVEGIAGRRFQSPFASPPGVGESPPVVNVIWGLANFFGGYTLIAGVGDFEYGLTHDVLMICIGAFLAAVALAVYFGRLRSP